MTTPSGQHWAGDRLILDVRIQPRASRNEIIGFQDDGRLKIRLTSPPVEDQANRQLILFLAKVFAVSRASITLLSGHKNRNKRLAITTPGHLPDFIHKPVE